MNQPTTFLIRKDIVDGNYIHVYINWPACDIDEAVAYEISKSFANMEPLPTSMANLTQWGICIEEREGDLRFIRYSIVNVHKFLKQIAREGLIYYHLSSVKIPTRSELLDFLNYGITTREVSK